MTQIALLAEHIDVIPTLAQWFQSQWPDYFAGRSLADIERDFYGDLNRDRIPLRLIAFEANELAGTVVLRERASETHAEFRPGLGGLYVADSYRRRGVGTELVRAGMAAARILRYQTLYATTHSAAGILTRLDWKQIRSLVHHGEMLSLYRCDLSELASAAAR